MAAYDIMSLARDLHATVMASHIGPMVEEIAVMCVFLASVCIWQSFCRKTRSPKSKFKAKQEAFRAEPKPPPAPAPPSPPCRRTAGLEGVQSDVGHAERKASLEKTMIQLIETHEFTRALNLFRNWERDAKDLRFSEDLYSAFIQSAVRVGKLDVMDRMLRIMRRSGVKPSPKFWQTTLKMLSSRKNFSAVLHVHSVFGREMKVDQVTLSCLVNAALEMDNPERAAAILDHVGAIDLDTRDYVLFFRTYQALNDSDSSEAVFHKLGKDTTNLMLNLLLLTCVNSSQPERALRILFEAHAFEKDGAAPIVDVVSYNTVIKGFARESNVGQCFECLREMSERGLDPDPITLGTLLDLCLAENQLEIAGELVNMMLHSKNDMDAVKFSLFVRGLVKANCLERALRLYEEMKRRKTAHLDLVTYSILIKALVHKLDLDRAVCCFEDMRSFGLRPDDIIYTHLLEGCRQANEHSRGQQIFDDMLKRSVRPSEFTLSTMLKLHGRCGFHQKAFDLVAGWEQHHGTKPTVIHFTCLVSGCLRTKSYEQAWEAYELMRECGVQPDSMCLSTLMPGLVAAHQWERVVELAKMARDRSSCTVPAETLNNALSQMESSRVPRELVEGLRLCMMAAGVPVTRRRGMPAVGGGRRGVGTTAAYTR